MYFCMVIIIIMKNLVDEIGKKEKEKQDVLCT